MLIRELNDPRLKLIYVTDVKVDKELAYADIFVSAVEGSSRSREILAWVRIGQRFHSPDAGGAGGIAGLSPAAFSLGPHAGERRPN